MMKIKLRNCLVTGGAGFIGSHLTKRLLKNGNKVIVLDDLSEGTWDNLPDHKKLIKIKGSILDDISAMVKNVDIIYHLAALPRLKRSIDEPLKTHNVNVNGSLNLLLAAKKHKVKRFVFASSSSIYGNNKTPFSEDMKPDPLVPYSLHKQMVEEYCRIFSDVWGLSTISLRYFNVYGPGMDPDSAYANLLPKFIKLLKQGKQPTINDNGKQRRDFTYIDDVVEATIMAGESDISGEVFNIGYGKNYSVNEVVSLLNRLMGKNIQPKHGPAVVEPRNTLADSQKARGLLGWKPKVSFEEGLSIMVQDRKSETSNR